MKVNELPEGWVWKMDGATVDRSQKETGGVVHKYQRIEWLAEHTASGHQISGRCSINVGPNDRTPFRDTVIEKATKLRLAFK